MKKKEIRNITLDDLKNKDFIKSLDKDEQKAAASLLRKEIIDKCATYGGHLSSNLGVVELTLALFEHFDFPKDKLIFDVGHQCYTQKILSGIGLDNLRQENGTDGFQKREESEYVSYEAGHSSTSISAAMGMALARDLRGENYQVICVVGDSSIANGVAFEALNNLSDFHHRMIVIVNDNEMSITKAKGGLTKVLRQLRISKSYIPSKTKYKNFMSKNKFLYTIYRFTAVIKEFFQGLIFKENVFEQLGLYYYGIVNGNKVSDLLKAFNRVKNFNGPVILHVKTKKGKGYSFAEKDAVGKYHGVPPFDIRTGEFLKKTESGKTTWSKEYATELYDLMRNHGNVISISPATGYGSALTPIANAFPARYFDVGIAEEHSVVFASGMASDGLKPYITIYSTFLQRSYDEIHHDMARMDLPVTLLIDRSGLTGDDGETHQGIYDYSYLSTIPNMTICMARDKKQARQLMQFSYTYQHPLAIRFPKEELLDDEITGNLERITENYWEIFNPQKKDAIISYGPIINDLIKADIDATIVNTVFMLPQNEEVLRSLLSCENIFIYDIYGVENGYAFDMKMKLLDLGYQGKIHIIAIPNVYVGKGTIQQQRMRYHVDLDSFLEQFRSLTCR